MTKESKSIQLLIDILKYAAIAVLAFILISAILRSI